MQIFSRYGQHITQSYGISPCVALNMEAMTRWKIFKKCGLWCCYGSVCEDHWRLGCDAVWSGTFIPMYVKRKMEAVHFSDMLVHM